jgi:hypothetical protein
MTELHLLIDDIRNEEMCGVTDIKFDITARTSRRGKTALENNPITHLWLDNDLGIGQQEGWEILNWAVAHNCLPDHVTLVTANPVSKRRMEEVLRNDVGYIRKDINSGWWHKQ